MKTQEFAQKFGMSVTELSEYSGYTRQALYNIIEGNAVVNTRRYESLLKRLKVDAWRHLCEEQRRTQAEYESQIAALEELKNRERKYDHAVNG